MVSQGETQVEDSRIFEKRLLRRSIELNSAGSVLNL